MLDQIYEALSPHLSSLGLSSARIDGRSTLQQRHDALERFNSDITCMIVLATIGAVGEGYVFSIPSWAYVSFSSTLYLGLRHFKTIVAR